MYRTGYAAISRSYIAHLKCPQRHKLYAYRYGDEGMTDVTCDLCQNGIHTEACFYGCRQCNIDLCDTCQRHVNQETLDRLAPNPPPAPVIEACCMLAIATIPNQQGRLTAAARGERYNGRRPNYRGLRVSQRDYPDPLQFGWTFTGSCEGGRAEFFEKNFGSDGIVKLDFYYTTGTVKTVLDHPRQGVTQLFAKGDSLSQQMYRQILQNPRHHTGNRYHTKQQQQPRTYGCTHCGKQLRSQEQLYNHTKDVHEFCACSQCGRSFAGRVAHNQHKRATGHY